MGPGINIEPANNDQNGNINGNGNRNASIIYIKQNKSKDMNGIKMYLNIEVGVK